MKNNKKLKILVSLFGLLIVLYVVHLIIESNSTKATFKSVLVDVDTATVNAIEIQPKGEAQPFKLAKESDIWKVIIGDKSYPADNNAVKNFLQLTDLIKTKRVVSKTDEKWKEYEVNDSLGNFIKIYDAGELVADFIVGKFSFTQSQNPYQRQPNVYSYIRLNNEDEVYMVDGMLSMSVAGDATGFRDGTLSKCNKNDLNKISFSYPADSSFIMTKNGDFWEIDGMPCDSLSAAKFAGSIANKTHRKYSTASVDAMNPDYSIELTGNNMETINIDMFVIAENEVAVRSSMNKENIFSFTPEEIKNLLKSKENFLIQ